ncbi:MAG: NADH-quinone oxidoreductase subunit NuoG [Methylococcales bacterium]
MATIIIDGAKHEVETDQNLLQACQTLGLDVPYFCWHPAMGSVGSCRQCAVTLFKDAEDKQGRLTMSCMTPVTDGQILALNNPDIIKFRDMQIEALMINHPHDCPVCEEGGECHLQDMTLMSGHVKRRFRGPKQTHVNQYLGPFIGHEMNRCIACYRCVRYYRDYSGGTDFDVFASRNNVYFGRAEDGDLENEFSGNLVEVCPTGVFTDKTYSQHYVRKWDLQSAPSICTQCSLGCNTFPAERNGILRRITNRYHPDINGYFLCDRGRFGYDFVNHSERLTQPWQRNTEQRSTDKITTQQAQQRLRELAKSSSVLAVGSARTSLENNFALRQLVGKDNFYADCSQQVLRQIQVLSQCHQYGLLPSSSLQTLESSDTALLIGEDITQTAPRIALSLRQMTGNAGKQKAAEMGIAAWQDAEVRNICQQLKSPLHIISSHATRLDDAAVNTLCLSPAQQVTLINEIDALLNNSIDAGVASRQARNIVKDLQTAKQPILVTGVHTDSEALLRATIQLGQTLYRLNSRTGFICALPQANSMGLALLTATEHNLDTALKKIEKSPPKTLILLETDLYRYCSEQLLEPLLNNIENIVVLDHLLTPTAQSADLLLPTTSFAEMHGSWVNYEGRVQAATSCFPAPDERRPGHLWFNAETDFHSLLIEVADCEAQLKSLPSLFTPQSEGFHLARQTIRATGRAAVKAVTNVREQQPQQDPDSPYQYSPEGAATLPEQPPAYLWHPNWNSNESLNRFQEEINGPIRGSHPGILLHEKASVVPSTDTTQPGYLLQDSSKPIAEGKLQLLADYNIFRDEELSSYVSAIQQRTPQAAIKMNLQQVKQSHCEGADKLKIKAPAGSCILPLYIDDSVPDGVALVPTNLLQQLGSVVQLERAE